jgi:hypothetical protein
MGAGEWVVRVTSRLYLLLSWKHFLQYGLA